MTAVHVNAYTKAVDAPQKASANVPSPVVIQFKKNVGTAALSAAYRNGKLHVSWTVGHRWSGAAMDVSANRLVRVDVSQIGQQIIPTTTASGFVDRTFGRKSGSDSLDFIH